jgi:transposase
MYYLGMDVHARMTMVCVLDSNGKHVLTKKVCGVPGMVVLAVQEFKKQLRGSLSICFEASCGYGWLYDRLAPLAERVVVAHPGQVRMIFRSKRKSDRIDAEKLAKLLFLNEVPPVHVPQADGRAWRRMIEYRCRLIVKQTAVKNTLKALLRTHGIVPPRSLWSQKGLVWLAKQDLDRFGELERDQLLEQLSQCREQLKRVEKALDERARREPAVALLQTIPGVGPRTAEAVAAYIDDPKRFHANRAIGCYFGLVPCEDSSGPQRLGHITKEGPGSVRRLLVQAAWQAKRRDKQWQMVFERIVNGDPDRRKIAIVALAHRLARVMLAMLKNGECYRAAA